MRPGLRWRLADIRRALRDALLAPPTESAPPEPLRGTARRVIVVPSPDPSIFEQAVFIVRDEYLRGSGRSQAELLRRARQAAGAYTAQKVPHGKRRLRPAAILSLAALLVLLTLSVLTLTGHI